jgi:hypothetical protein
MADTPQPTKTVDPKTGILKIQHPPQSMADTIKNAIGALADAVAPRSIVDRKKNIDSTVETESNSPQTTQLGDQF